MPGPGGDIRLGESVDVKSAAEPGSAGLDQTPVARSEQESARLRDGSYHMSTSLA
ncbi:MAG: hypothetical protein Kow00120_16170 [Anaerolineae bacterium]